VADLSSKCESAKDGASVAEKVKDGEKERETEKGRRRGEWREGQEVELATKRGLRKEETEA